MRAGAFCSNLRSTCAERHGRTRGRFLLGANSGQPLLHRDSENKAKKSKKREHCAIFIHCLLTKLTLYELIFAE